MTLLRPPERLTRTYMTRLERVRAMSAAQITALFDRMVDVPAMAPLFVDEIVPMVLAGQTAVVAEVDAYLSISAGLMTGTSTTPVGLDASQLIGAKARNGTPLETVYRRPFFDWERRQAELVEQALAELPAGSIRRQSSQIGREQLRAFARARLAQDVITDMQLAQRDAAWARVQIDPRLPRWRRVLSGSESCPLCTTASTQTYGKIRRIALHPHCDCGIEPVGDARVMALPNQRELPAVYRRMVDLRKRGTGLKSEVDPTGPVVLYPDRLNATVDTGAFPKVEVVDHGELGPTLWVQGQHFTQL